jgi:hypothetical protein
MSEQDPHSPTTAGPTPADTGAAPGADPVTPVTGAGAPSPEPTPTVPPAAGTAGRPAGTALPGGPAVNELAEERPEVLVGAAFAGGILGAMMLKRITRGRR